MPEPVGPAVARDRLRAQLLELRTARDMSLERAAGVLHWPPSALEDVEDGRRTIHPREVAALLAAYGVSDRTALTALAHHARSALWWERNGLSDAFRQYTALEAEAVRISVYQPLLVPGLLQTEAYARAATAAVLGPAADDADVGARVDIRLERQDVLAERVAAGAAPQVLVALEEAVLHRPVGGRRVLHAQLDHLIDMARQPHVTLVVMPTATSGHAGLGGVFELLEFADAPDLVFLESLSGDHIVRDARATTRYRANAEALPAVGRTGNAALEMIEEAKLFRTGT